MSEARINIFWFRRDLRLDDNVGLSKALSTDVATLPLFIFDANILDELEYDDARVTFIYDKLIEIQEELTKLGSGILIKVGDPIKVFEELCGQFAIDSLYCNRDYEPYARERDESIKQLLQRKGIDFKSFKDQVIFEADEILKSDGKPYTVYTPYKNAWLKKFEVPVNIVESGNHWFIHQSRFPKLEEIGFKRSSVNVEAYDLSVLDKYVQSRDIPSLDATSKLGPHLRFGTIGIRQLINEILKTEHNNDVFLSELIWREFFFQILYHFPHVVDQNFRSKYNGIQWRNNEGEFKKWCDGETGYPLVDAGMRQLNQTGYMHNRVRMITAGFLCKHLLIDWRWGEAYFAQKLLDYELSSNNGNWQWAAGTGCDAAPYFRVFNPTEQVKKFDPKLSYIQRWVPEVDSLNYPKPMVEHKFARERAINTYKAGIIN